MGMSWSISIIRLRLYLQTLTRLPGMVLHMQLRLRSLGTSQLSTITLRLLLGWDTEPQATSQMSNLAASHSRAWSPRTTFAWTTLCSNSSATTRSLFSHSTFGGTIGSLWHRIPKLVVFWELDTSRAIKTTIVSGRTWSQKESQLGLRSHWSQTTLTGLGYPTPLTWPMFPTAPSWWLVTTTKQFGKILTTLPNLSPLLTTPIIGPSLCHNSRLATRTLQRKAIRLRRTQIWLSNTTIRPSLHWDIQASHYLPLVLLNSRQLSTTYPIMSGIALSEWATYVLRPFHAPPSWEVQGQATTWQDSTSG